MPIHVGDYVGPKENCNVLLEIHSRSQNFTPSSCKPVADGYSRKKDVVVVMLGMYAWSHQTKKSSEEVCWSHVRGLSRTEELVAKGDCIYPDFPWQRC